MDLAAADHNRTRQFCLLARTTKLLQFALSPHIYDASKRPVVVKGTSSAVMLFHNRLMSATWLATHRQGWWRGGTRIILFLPEFWRGIGHGHSWPGRSILSFSFSISLPFSTFSLNSKKSSPKVYLSSYLLFYYFSLYYMSHKVFFFKFAMIIFNFNLFFYIYTHIIFKIKI